VTVSASILFLHPSLSTSFMHCKHLQLLNRFALHPFLLVYVRNAYHCLRNTFYYAHARTDYLRPWKSNVKLLERKTFTYAPTVQ
jgi:hypothetical protein